MTSPTYSILRIPTRPSMSAKAPIDAADHPQPRQEHEGCLPREEDRRDDAYAAEDGSGHERGDRPAAPTPSDDRRDRKLSAPHRPHARVPSSSSSRVRGLMRGPSRTRKGS